MKNLSIYIHWPYCLSKCPYCDFNSRASAEIDHQGMAEAFCLEIDTYAKNLKDRRIHTIYFGGGTPSLMKTRTVSRIIDRIAKHWPIDDQTEITIEANPTSAEAWKFKDFKKSGVNRLSLGVQALDEKSLVFLGRKHSVLEAEKAIQMAKDIFSRTSFDLIYARGGQTLKAWERELTRALDFEPSHLSLYQLTIEKGSVFYKCINRDELKASEETAVEMYQATESLLLPEGLVNYEVSNYARAGDESRHNLVYWNYEDYIGIGPGAHGRFVDQECRNAISNCKTPEVWMKHVHDQGLGFDQKSKLTENEARTEALLMGLRLTKGIDFSHWKDLFGSDLLAFIEKEKIDRLVKEDLLLCDDDRLCTTQKGRLCLNSVTAFLL